jgi:predicted CxxxxCH...CXXCH cytochrome family protein
LRCSSTACHNTGETAFLGPHPIRSISKTTYVSH